MDKGERAETWVGMLRDAGVPVSANTRILDLGCGAGRMVHAGRERGYNFYGAGVNMHDAHHRADPALVQQGILRPIETEPYHIPFEDGFFDACISDQVFEHVMDYPTTLRELHRVLKPGAAFLHLFPGCYRPIEPHVWVPLACTFRPRWWLKLWALMGVRNEFQKKLSASEASEASFKYLTSHTNYLSKRQLRREFSRNFTDIDFIEDVFLRNSRRGGKFYKRVRWIPLLPQLYGAFRTRAVFGRRADSAGDQETIQPVADGSRVTPRSAVAARISAPCP